MKILVVVPGLGNGGAERIATQLAIQQHNEGNQVTVLSYYQDHSFANYKFLKENNVNVIFLDKKAGIDISLFRKVSKIIRLEKPDVIQTHVDSLLYLLPVHGQLIFHTIHSIASYEATGLQKIVRIIAFKVKGVIPIAIGDTIKKTISEYYSIDESRIPVIYNGTALTAKYNTKTLKQPVVFCITGSLAQVKNHSLALKAFHQIKKRGYSFELLILGDGELKSQLVAEMNNLDLGDYVRFMGYQSNVGQFLSISDVYICCSRVEGISVAIIEAMRFGLPIIASNVGGNPDLIKDSFNGFLFRDNDVEDLTQKIELIINAKNEYSNYSKNAYEQSKKYTIEECSKGYLELYRNTLNKKKRNGYQ